MANFRTNKWGFIQYEESTPEDYREKLESLHIPYILSPWHDMDIDKKTGKLLKPHRHGAFYFDSLKSYDQVSKIVTDVLNGPSKVEPIHSPKGMYDYFVHASNPEKAQYNIEDIECGAGFDLEKFLIINHSDSLTVELIDIIEEYDIMELKDLINYTRKNNLTYLQFLFGRTYFFSQFINSRRNSYLNEKE